ncbi:MAG: 4a-hydroxytetrahydrobiopterin dehydratase [Planctomycetes bacterium]|jgi:4a-hydroxytetrahydrobiopterin dehydratase|nr:4a-hydroxytetrahydrobiopterin dehydratase [Planctomycetota bacterium]
MSASSDELLRKKCLPCEGGVEACSLEQARMQQGAVPRWELRADGKWIDRTVRFKNFVKMMEAVHRIAELSEAEGHHPDLHLTGYRNLKIELTTHAIGGLSENDFILAAKIDAILAQAGV